MIRIAVCDDDIISLEMLYFLINNYMDAQTDEEFNVRMFHSANDLIECLENPNRSFNIYFLDIIMPMFNGIEVGQMIRRNDEYSVIIYTTASSDYALDASATSPLKYLLKPIQPDQLKLVLDSALRYLGQMRAKNLLIKRKDGLSNIMLHQIEYVEYQEHALTFYLKGGKAISSRVVHESFSEIVKTALNDPRFIRPHESYVVNMDLVRSLNSNDFQMDSGALIPISKRVYPKIKQQFISYMLEKKDATIL